MRALVTGANGFVGSNIVRDLLKCGYSVRGLVRESSNMINLKDLDIDTYIGDLRDYGSLVGATEGIEVAFHPAAVYRFWSPDPDIFDQVNVEGTKNLLKAASENGLERVVVTSTASLLAHSDDRSLPEDPSSMPSNYKRTKLLAERAALRYGQSGGPEVLIASPTVPLGPGDYSPTPTGRMVLEFLQGRMTGFLEMKFNVVSVADVAEGHRLVLEKGEPGERYVLGNRNMRLSEILWLLSKLTGISLPKFKIPHPVAYTAARVDQ